MRKRACDYILEKYTKDDSDKDTHSNYLIDPVGRRRQWRRQALLSLTYRETINIYTSYLQDGAPNGSLRWWWWRGIDQDQGKRSPFFFYLFFLTIYPSLVVARQKTDSWRRRRSINANCVGIIDVRWLVSRLCSSYKDGPVFNARSRWNVTKRARPPFFLLLLTLSCSFFSPSDLIWRPLAYSFDPHFSSSPHLFCRSFYLSLCLWPFSFFFADRDVSPSDHPALVRNSRHFFLWLCECRVEAHSLIGKTLFLSNVATPADGFCLVVYVVYGSLYR